MIAKCCHSPKTLDAQSVQLQTRAPIDLDYLSNARSYHISWSPKREVVQETKPQFRLQRFQWRLHRVAKQKGTNYYYTLVRFHGSLVSERLATKLDAIRTDSAADYLATE